MPLACAKVVQTENSGRDLCKLCARILARRGVRGCSNPARPVKRASSPARRRATGSEAGAPTSGQGSPRQRAADGVQRGRRRRQAESDLSTGSACMVAWQRGERQGGVEEFFSSGREGYPPSAGRPLLRHSFAFGVPPFEYTLSCKMVETASPPCAPMRRGKSRSLAVNGCHALNSAAQDCCWLDGTPDLRVNCNHVQKTIPGESRGGFLS